MSKKAYLTRLDSFPPAAHIVVIKDVKIYQNGVSQEYSDLDITQMIGRAVSQLDFRSVR
jgi:hypothetical protein